ncbi:MAG: cation:proton antiporter [Deltaproteobacteria bacterium]|nr:cation:proton antiporter [bacterium]MCB9487870.1 cation:proton antiporter [Deltaproteobacteria bacterium]
MKSLVGLAIIALLAVFGSRLLERHWHIPGPLKSVFGGGLIYLVAGYVLGPSMLGYVTGEVTVHLSPVVTIGLFWIAFLFGINLKWRDLRRLHNTLFLFVFGQAFAVVAVVGVAFWFLLPSVFGEIPLRELTAAVLTLAACASGTGQATLFRLKMNRNFRGPTAQTASVAATLDDLPAIIVTGLVTFFLHEATPAETHPPGFAWLGLAVSIGGLGGWVVELLLRRADNDQARLLLILGCMSVGGGICAYLSIAPVFVGAIMGVVYVNLSPRDDRVFEIVTRSESTLYVVFLILVGTIVKLQLEQLAILGAVFVGVRILGKVGGGALFQHWLRLPQNPSPAVGLALIAQGGLAIALAIQYARVFPSALADTVVTVVIASVVVNAVYAEPLALRAARAKR